MQNVILLIQQSKIEYLIVCILFVYLSILKDIHLCLSDLLNEI